MVVFGLKGLYSGIVVVFRKSGCIGESGCIRVRWYIQAKVVVFGQKWLYSGKSGCIQAKWFY